MDDMAVDIGNLTCIQVLGTRVHVVHISEIIEIMTQWIELKSKKCHQIVNTGMHGIMEAHRDPEFKSILNSVDLMAPDGILVALTARLKGYPIKKENISLFRDFLIKNFKKSQLGSSKNVNLYLDSVIAPSALNEKFYEDINFLAPFGAGNSEPRFVIENLQVISVLMIICLLRMEYLIFLFMPKFLSIN